MRPLPKAGARKQTNRKRGKTMILTDTPIKEALEAEARAREERKQPKMRKIQLPQDDDTSDSDADKDPPVLSDSEEGSNEEEADSLTMEPGRYVVVRYSSKKYLKCT